MASNHVRQGFGTVRPYLYGPYELPEFLTAVFDAREMERHEASGRRAAHVELAIGDSVIVVEAGEMPPAVNPTEASIYVYIEDVDAAYRRALDAGAEAITAPEDKPYGERGCGFRACGNTWWVATHLGSG
ncbi:MAG: VOC family protein [Gammaproteobacteria bacterium]|nr:VOC family protein [Gammaproteobacteria bacterium]